MNNGRRTSSLLHRTHNLRQQASPSLHSPRDAETKKIKIPIFDFDNHDIAVDNPEQVNAVRRPPGTKHPLRHLQSIPSHYSPSTSEPVLRLEPDMFPKHAVDKPTVDMISLSL